MHSATHRYPTLGLIEGRLTVSIEEVAAILGTSRSMVYGAVRCGQLPSRRLGRRIVIPVPLLLDWLGVSADRVPFRPGGSKCRRAM